MSEENQQQQTNAVHSAGGDTPTPVNQLDRAESLVKTLEEQNKKAEEITARMEQAAARMILGGRADAGREALTPEEMKKREAQSMADEMVKAFKR